MSFNGFILSIIASVIAGLILWKLSRKKTDTSQKQILSVNSNQKIVTRLPSKSNDSKIIKQDQTAAIKSSQKYEER